METELGKYLWFRDTVKRLLILGGLWPHLEDTCRLYRLLTCASALVLAAMASKVLGFTLANITKLTVLVNGMCFIFGYSSSALKIGYFVKYRQDLVLLDNTLGKKFEKELEVREYRPLLLRHISQYTWLTGTSCGITAVTLSVLSILPIIYTLRHKKYVYILQGKYPFPIEGGSLLYWSIITVEASAGYFLFTLVTGGDNAFGLHGFRMCGMLRLVGHKYSQLRSAADLIESVRIHQMILRSRDALQRVYGPIVLLTYLTSSLIMCSLMYQVNQVMQHITLGKVLFLTFYILLKLIQAFTYAYYGSQISKESEKCLDAVYFSDWALCGNLRLMKDILMISMQKPIILNVRNFFVITMDVFAKIVQTSISYFFLLQTVTKED